MYKLLESDIDDAMDTTDETKTSLKGLEEQRKQLEKENEERKAKLKRLKEEEKAAKEALEKGRSNLKTTQLCIAFMECNIEKKPKKP